MQLTKNWETDNYDVKVRLMLGDSVWEPKPGEKITCIDQMTGDMYFLQNSEKGWHLTFEPEIDHEGWDYNNSDALDQADLVDGWQYAGWEEGKGHVYSWKGELEIPCSPENLFVLDDEGYYTLKPYMLYILPMDKESSYTLTEKAESAFWFGTWTDKNNDGYSYVINQKDPKVIRGTVKTDPVATVYNEDRVVSGSVVEKRMTGGSAPVPAGKNLVWQVERYNSSTGEWDRICSDGRSGSTGIHCPEGSKSHERRRKDCIEPR